VAGAAQHGQGEQPSPARAGAVLLVGAHAQQVVGLSLRHRHAAILGAVLAEQHDEWIEGRRYFGLDVLQRSRLTLITTPETEEVREPLTAPAISA
jgi:hypothetical protein